MNTVTHFHSKLANQLRLIYVTVTAHMVSYPVRNVSQLNLAFLSCHVQGTCIHCNRKYIISEMYTLQVDPDSAPISRATDTLYRL